MTIQFSQVVPKPFCSQGPFDYLVVQGPVVLEQDVETLSGVSWSSASEPTAVSWRRRSIRSPGCRPGRSFGRRSASGRTVGPPRRWPGLRNATPAALTRGTAWCWKSEHQVQGRSRSGSNLRANAIVQIAAATPGDRIGRSGILQVMRNFLPMALATGGLLFGSRRLGAQAASMPMDTALARRYFAEAVDLTSRDGGGLWGRSLQGPILFVRRAGSFSALCPAVGTPCDRWEGCSPARCPRRSRSRTPRCAGPDTLGHGGLAAAGRLAGAPGAPGPRALAPHPGQPRPPVGDAIECPPRHPGWPALAPARRAGPPQGAGRCRDAAPPRAGGRDRVPSRAPVIVPGSESDERTLELNEGLAEYSGIMLAIESPVARREQADRRLGILDSATHFERDFAYHTGPAWGLALDDVAPGWRAGLRAGDDLAMIAAQYLGTLRGAARSASAREPPTDWPRCGGAKTPGSRREGSTSPRSRPAS